MSLPWDRWQPGEPVPEPPLPEPELPYAPYTPRTATPTAPEPSPPSPTPISPTVSPVVEGSVVTDAELKDLAKDVFAEAMEYVKGTMAAVKQDMTVDHAHPTVTATTAAGKELVVADARNRSARTLIQGLIFDLFAGLVAVVASLAGADPFQKETWIAFGVLLLKTLVSAGISYFMRLRVTPTVRTKGEQMQIVPLMAPMPEKPEAA